MVEIIKAKSDVIQHLSTSYENRVTNSVTSLSQNTSLSEGHSVVRTNLPSYSNGPVFKFRTGPPSVRPNQWVLHLLQKCNKIRNVTVGTHESYSLGYGLQYRLPLSGTYSWILYVP